MPAPAPSQPETASPQYEEIWKDAITKYEQDTKVSLLSTTAKLNSVDDVLHLVEEESKKFSEFRKKGQLPPVVKSFLSLVEACAVVAGEGVDVTYPPGKAIFASVSVLFNAAKGVSSNYNSIIEMFDEFTSFLGRLPLYLKHEITPSLKRVIVDVLAQLLTTIGLKTKLIKEGRAGRFFKAFWGRHTDVEDAMGRLGKLCQHESLVVGADTHAGVNGIKLDLGFMRSDQLRSKIDAWLDAPDPSSNHTAAQEKRGKNTGDWFVQGKQFLEWKGIPRSFLWIHGSSGSGKSVLCSTIIEAVRSKCGDKPSLAFAYFYFDFRDPSKHDYRKLLCSLIKQLSWRSTTIPSDLQQLYTQMQSGSQKPTLDALLTVLKELTKPFQHTYIVFDALDECTGMERRDVLGFIETLVGWGFDNIHLLATSQKPTDIERRLGMLTCTQLDLKVMESLRQDIQIHIRAMLAEDERARHWKDTEKQEIEKALMENANGMFRWVACQLEDLLDCVTPRKRKEKLRSLPRDLAETYERILLRVDRESHGSYVLLVLKWLAFSVRPLTLRELSAALGVDPQDGAPVSDDDRVGDAREVLGKCSSLVTISAREYFDEDNCQVQFAHISVQTYLTSKEIRKGEAQYFSLNPESSHTAIAQTCLGILRRLDNPDSVDSEIPLAQYAAQYWIEHYRSGGVASSELEQSAIAVFQPESAQFFNWIRLYDIEHPWRSYGKRSRSTIAPPLYYASYAGLPEISKRLLGAGADANAVGGEYGSSTALYVASYGGHEAIVRLLLENGADVNVVGGEYDTALYVASRDGHEAIVRLLLERGADVNAVGGWYGTALQAASHSGCEVIVRLLLEKGADINAVGGGYNTALQAASGEGHEAVVGLLLEKGADVNAVGGDYGTALQGASAGGHEAIVRLLLEKDAYINAAGGKYGTALQAASKGDHEMIVRLLLGKDADGNKRWSIFTQYSWLDFTIVDTE